MRPVPDQVPRRPSAWTAKAQNPNGRRLKPRTPEEVREALKDYVHTPSPESLRRAEDFERCMRGGNLYQTVD